MSYFQKLKIIWDGGILKPVVYKRLYKNPGFIFNLKKKWNFLGVFFISSVI